MTPFLMGRTSSTITQNLGEIEQRATAVGAKILCLYVCFFVTLPGRRAIRSSATYFEQVLCRGLWVDFDTVYIVFSAFLGSTL